jgi:O-antigen/teichoic acid export membrane protein
MLPESSAFKRTYLYSFLLNTWNHSGFQKYFKNTSWMLFAHLFSLSVAFLISAWLARYLGPTNYGVYSYAISFVGLFTFIANLGVDGVMSKELVNSSDKDREVLLGTSYTIKLVGSIIAVLVVFTASSILIDDYLARWLVIIYSLVFLFDPLNILTVYFQSQVRSKINSLIKIYTLAISSVLKIILILSGLGVVWLTAIFVIESFLVNLFLLSYYRKDDLSVFNWRFDLVLAKRILSLSFFVILANSFNYIFMKSDQIIIRNMLGDTEVGLYAVAIKFLDVWYYIPTIVTLSVFPALVNSKHVSERLYLKRIRNMLYVLFFMGLLVSLVSILIAPFVINLFFGIKYIESAYLIQIYSISSIGVFLSWGIQNYFLSRSKTSYMFLYYLLASVVTVPLIIFMINSYGLNGAAWAMVISTNMIPFSFLLLIRNSFKTVQ